MMTDISYPDFSTLLNIDDAEVLLQQLVDLENEVKEEPNDTIKAQTNKYLKSLKRQWRRSSVADRPYDQDNINGNTLVEYSEQAATDCLITLFNTLFATQQVTLVRGDQEPEYFPIRNAKPARIKFAHGFFASALHELSHWCIAGEKRRQLADFGYWYAPDGRSAAQQQEFEHLEIKPQALECLFTLACKRPFRISQDNLFADFDTSSNTFADDVYQQASQYIAMPRSLPRDAKTLLRALLTVCITQ